MKRIHCEVLGRVQSCGFRDFCWKCAQKTSITGWAANDTSDIHHVVLEVQGEEEQLEKFFSLILKKNDRYRIDSLEKTEITPAADEKGFLAKYRLK